VIEVATGRLDGDVVGRQPDVGVGATVVLLDVRLEVVKVGDRSETGHQRGEGSDGHVVSVASDLGGTLVLCGGHDLGPMLAILVRDRSLRVAVIRLVLGASSVLDVMAIALFTHHDAVDGTRGAVLAIVVQATSMLPLFTLTMALVDGATSIATVPVLVEVGVQVGALRGVCPGLVDLLLDGVELAMRRSIRSTAQMPTRHRCRRLGRRTPFFHLGCGNPEVSHGCISLGRWVSLLETCRSRTQVGPRAVERRQPRLFELET
jgi:hypothetical protein